jgi:hypothetical protein
LNALHPCPTTRKTGVQTQKCTNTIGESLPVKIPLMGVSAVLDRCIRAKSNLPPMHRHRL